MSPSRRALEILHPCLTDSRHGVPLTAVTLSDRQRLGVLLEGCALDAHLARVGRRPADAWRSARISGRGRLVAVTIATDASGKDVGETATERAILLLRRLFATDEVPGRGEARRIARELHRRWALYLLPAAGDELVADVLHAAPFLWHGRFAGYRESLGALLRDDGVASLVVAGPAAFRRRVLQHARALPELLALLRSDRSGALWRGELAHEVREPRSGSWEGQLDRGGLDRVVALHDAGRWRAVLRASHRLRRHGEARGGEIELARLAIDAELHLRHWRGAADWADFALGSADAASRQEARLLAAWVARQSGDPEVAPLEAPIEPPPAAGSIEPLLLWARIEGERRGPGVIERLSAALRDRSRRGAHERGRLWLELGRARQAEGAGAASERALAHAHRLLRRDDHPISLWWTAAALAESRIGRGALLGIEDVVASLGHQARASADRARELAATILGVRLELARDRCDRAAADAGALLDRLPRARRDRAARELEALLELARRGLDGRVAASAQGELAGALAPRAAGVPRRAELTDDEGGIASGLPSTMLARTPAMLRGDIVGGSRALSDALRRIDRLARGEVPVLLYGETGTGKELAAKRLHAGSPRRERPLLAVNCAALSESLLLSELFGHARGAFTGADREHAGVFEAAQGGVVFLDEIGDLPVGAQGALLRVLQEGEVRRLGESRPRRVDVRVVAATHRDLAQAVERGSFRQDLYYRLNVATVRLPPLRERGEDVLLLARHFLAEQGAGFELAADAEQTLLACAWPGNVRELRSVIQVAAAIHEGVGLLRARDLELPAPRRPGVSYHAALDAERRRLVLDALAATGGRRPEAARRLGITPQAVSYLVRRLGLELPVTASDAAMESVMDCRRARHKVSDATRSGLRRESPRASE